MKRTGDKDRADLVEQIITFVAPTRGRRAQCAKQIEDDIALVRLVAVGLAGVPSRKKIRDDVDRLALTLKKARTIARQLPAAVLPHTLFDEHFGTQLDAVIAAAEEFAKDLIVGGGKQEWNGTKYVAKLRAHALVRDFSSASRGREGRISEAAALLFQIVTGQKVEDLSDYRIHDDRRLDRVEPKLRRKFVAG